MAEYTGGYTSALNDIERRDQSRAQTSQILANIAQQAFQQGQFRQEQESAGGLWDAILRAAGGSEDMGQATTPEAPSMSTSPPPVGEITGAPAPGVTLSPYRPIPPPQPGGMPPPGPPMSGPPGPVQPPSPVMAGPASLPPGASPSAPAGATLGAPPGGMPMGAGVGMGSGMAAPGAAPPQPPQGWQPMPTGQPPQAMGGPGPMPGMPSTPKLPEKLLSVPNLMRELNKNQNLTASQKLRALQMAEPFIQAQNKQEIAEAKIQLQAQDRIAKMTELVMKQQEREIRELREGKKLEETGRHNVAMEKTADRRAAAAEARASGMGGAGAGGNVMLSPETARRMAEQYWNGDERVLSGLGYGNVGAKNRAMVNEAITEIGKERGQGGSDVMGRRAEFIASRGAFNALTKDLAAIRPYKQMLDLNAKILEDLAKKAVATNSQLANKPINWLRMNVGDNPDIAEYLFQMNTVATEAARVLNNPRLVGQLTDSARKDMQSVINGEMPLNMTSAILARMKADGTNRVKAMEDEEGRLKSRISGRQAPSAPSGTDAPIKEFATEAEAKAANLPSGTKITIGGRKATVQ